MKQIICMKWGDRYPADYVNKLYGMVSRNISGDFRLVCLTDDRRNIRPEVECLDCPTIPIPSSRCNSTWRKISLWAEHLPEMEGDWLFLDLDIVITGRLDEFFEYQPSATFVVMQNWTQPGTGIGNTSVFRFRVGSHAYLLHNLVHNHADVFRKFRNEQIYISRTINSIEFWPDEWCVLFKVQCVPPMPSRWWKPPAVPAHARIVAFPGVPNPHEAVAGRWPARWYKRLYKHTRPATWIDDYWRE